MVREAHVQHVRPPKGRVRHAGFLLGVGMGALLETTALSGLFGWPGLRGGTGPDLAQGLYHLAALLVTVGGVSLLHRARSRLLEPHSGRVLMGSALGGAGSVVLLEGLVAHLLLGLHRAGPGGAGGAWDAGYLLAGALLVAVGARLVTSAGTMRGTEEAARERRRGARRTSGRVP